MKNERMAIYLRYGKAAQNKKIDALDEIVKDFKNWELVHRYVDDGFSAMGKNRPALNHMIEDCRNGKADIVCINGVHQFSRDPLTVIRMFKLFKDYGVKVYDVSLGKFVGLVG